MKLLRSVFVLLAGFLLIACTTEKKMLVKNVEPDKAFITAQAILREKMPAAKMTVEINTRYLKVTDQGSEDYPDSIELKFSRETSNTLVTVTAEGDQQQLENLYYLFGGLSKGIEPQMGGKVDVKQGAPTVPLRPSGPMDRPY